MRPFKSEIETVSLVNSRGVTIELRYVALVSRAGIRQDIVKRTEEFKTRQAAERWINSQRSVHLANVDYLTIA